MKQHTVSAWLLIFSAQPRISGKPANPVKFTKMCEIPRNSREILSYTCQYNIFETYLGYWGCLFAENLQIYLEASSPQCVNNVPKLPGVNYVAKNWALVIMLKALPLVHFSSALGLAHATGVHG